jgi:hypothetical protein
MFTRVQPVASARSKDHLQLQLGRHLGDDLGVVAAAEGGVQINEMDPLGAGILPAPGGRSWVAEHLLRSGHALHQLDRLATGHVHCRQQLQPVTTPSTHADDPIAGRRQIRFSRRRWPARAAAGPIG